MQRETLISRVDDLDSELELQVLSSAIGSAARTLDDAGVDIARSIMDGGNFDDMVSRAAAKVGMTQSAAREVLQDAVFFGVSEISHESLTRTDGIAEAGHQAAAAGDYAAAAAADASARAEAAALEAAGLTEEAAKVAEIAQAEAELAAEAAEYATQVAAEQVQAAAEKAAVEAHHAAVEATYAAERAAHKAEFIATAMAEGVSREDAERLATEAGH